MLPNMESLDVRLVPSVQTPKNSHLLDSDFLRTFPKARVKRMTELDWTPVQSVERRFKVSLIN